VASALVSFITDPDSSCFAQKQAINGAAAYSLLCSDEFPTTVISVALNQFVDELPDSVISIDQQRAPHLVPPQRQFQHRIAPRLLVSRFTRLACLA